MTKAPAVAALFLACALLLAGQTTTHLVLHASRQAPTDLEVSGDVPALAAGKTGFLSYQELLALPQVSSSSTYEDDNFHKPVKITGVPLEEIKRSLGANGDIMVAVCADGYRGNYPTGYVAAHHPVLVLTVNGQPQSDWPKAHGGQALGPYVVANPNFVPSFQVLSHADEAQIPFQVVRLDFRNESEVFGPIRPQGQYAAGSPVMDGYKIAQQNCYRCHNMGAEGGRMASIPWPVITAIAKSNPDFFAKYVRNPQAVNPNSRMAASPGYDDQTIAALRAYFSTFAGGN